MTWSPWKGRLTYSVACMWGRLLVTQLASAGSFLFRLQLQRTNKLESEWTLHEGRRTPSSGSSWLIFSECLEQESWPILAFYSDPLAGRVIDPVLSTLWGKCLIVSLSNQRDCSYDMFERRCQFVRSACHVSLPSLCLFPSFFFFLNQKHTCV